MCKFEDVLMILYNKMLPNLLISYLENRGLLKLSYFLLCHNQFETELLLLTFLKRLLEKFIYMIAEKDTKKSYFYVLYMKYISTNTNFGPKFVTLERLKY